MANSDIIKIGFDYRASLEQFEKETNGVFDGISNKAGKQKITIQLDAKDDKVIDKIKELQKLKLDKFTFEFGDSGLKEQLQTFDKLENKINEIINLSKRIDLSFNTKNKTDAYNQLKKYADAFKDYYGNEEAMATNAGTKAGYAYYKAYEEALRKGVAQSKLEKVTIDFDANDSIFSKERIVENRIKEFENFQKYGNADENNLIAEITLLENRLLKFNSAYSQVKANLGDAPITPEITKNIENYVRLLEVAENRATDAELFGFSSEDINSDKDLANMYLDFAKEDATAENKKYIESLKQQETQAISTAEAEQKLAEAQKETVSNTSNSNNSQIEELKSDIQEVKTELGDVKDRISSIESNGFENVRDDVEKTKESVKELNSEFAEMKSNLSSTPQESNISSASTPAIEQQNKLQEELKETQQQAEKARQAISELGETRDIVSQNWYREKGTVVGKDSKGNDITRDADEFSFVERLKNGQLQTILATYNEETGKWAEQIINVRTAFEQVEKAIISADNKIASLEMIKEKTLVAHPGYDTTADDNQITIERKKRDELQNTLNLYGQEKEYIFEIEAANKRIADNQERLNNKKQSQTNLQTTKESETIEKQLQKEIEASDKANQKKFQDFQKEQANYEESVNKVNSAIQKTDEILDTLPLHDKLDGQFLDMIDSVDNLNSKLKSGELTLLEYKNEVKSVTSEYSKMVSIQQNRDVENYNANVKADNAKKLEQEKQVWNELTTSLNRYATLRKRIASNNALSTDVEEVKNLKSHIDDLKESDILPKDKLNIVDEKLQQINQTVTDLKAKLKESTLDSLQGSIDKYKKIYDQRSTYSSDFTPSEQYTKNLTELNTAIKNLIEYRNTLKNVSEVTAEQEAELKRMVVTCEKASDSFKSLSASEKGASQIAVDKLVQRINKDLDECTNYSKEAKLGLRALRDELESANPRNLKEITSEIINIENAEIRAGRAGRSFFDTLKNSGFHQLAAQMAGMFGFYDVINGLKQVASTVIDLNTQIIDLAKVSEATSSQIYDDFSSYADIAKDIGGTISDTISATADWSRNGYNLPDSKELASIALLYKNVGDGIDIDTANESLISTLRGFKMEADEAEKIIDIFNNVSNNEPIDSGGIGEALQRSAAAFNAANTSLEKSVALIATTNSVVQDPDKVGNMWKVVSARLRGSETELQQMGEDTDGLVKSTSKLQSLVKGITGFDIMQDENTYKDIYDIVLGISKTWKDLNDIDRASLLEALAGKMQSNSLAAAFANPDILVKSYKEAMESAGSAMEEQLKYQESVQYSIDQTKAKLEEISNDLLSSDFLKGAIDAGGKLIDILDGIVKSGNAISILFTTISGYLGSKNLGWQTKMTLWCDAQYIPRAEVRILG